MPRLTQEQKEIIKTLHSNGNSITSIAKKFNVTRASIQYLLNPEKQDVMKARATEYQKAKATFTKEDIIKQKEEKLQKVNAKIEKLQKELQKANITRMGLLNYLSINN